MAGYSPIEALRRLASVADADAVSVFGVAGREDLLAAVTSLRFGRRSRLRPSTLRGRLVLAAAVLALAGIATAGTWAILRAPAKETTAVECMNGSSDAIIPSVTGDPAADCAAAWQGAFGTPAPPLAAYDNGDGGVSVIPRSEKPWAGWTPIKSQDVALIELQESLDDYIAGLASGCLDASAATSLVDARLAQFGFTGWNVAVRSSQSGAAPGGCYSGEVIEPATKTVTVIPFGTPGGDAILQQFAAKLRPVAQACSTLQFAVAAVKTEGASLGLSPAPPETSKTYNLYEVPDSSLRCALVYYDLDDVIVRGPSG